MNQKEYRKFEREQRVNEAAEIILHYITLASENKKIDMGDARSEIEWALTLVAEVSQFYSAGV